MTIVACKVAETKNARAYTISFDLSGETSCIFDATKEKTNDKDEILKAVLDAVKSAPIEVVEKI